MYWLKLIRWQNLLIVFLTQFLAWFCVILPVFKFSGSQPFLTTQNFLFLSLSTVFITAAGYIINDYFDIKIDIINKPDKVILEKNIPLRMAIVTHSVLTLCGLILSAIVAKRAGHYSWLLLQLFCTVLLWFYSTHFKRQFMSGNVVVAILTAMTIIVLMVFETGLHPYYAKNGFIETKGNPIPNPIWVLGIYACFAFTLTWMREIVKDMEDFKGDANEGCITMPIKWGLLRSVRFTQVLGLLAIIPLIIGAVKLFIAEWWVLGTYTLAALAIPILLWILYLPAKATTPHYHLASRRLKIIMVLGLASLIIYYLKLQSLVYA